METRLLVTNLSNETTEENLRSMFAQVGTVKEVVLVKDDETGSSKGYSYAYVTMNSLEKANKAIYVFNGRTLDGRELKVNAVRTNDGNDDSRPRDQSNRSQNRSGGSKRSYRSTCRDREKHFCTIEIRAAHYQGERHSGDC